MLYANSSVSEEDTLKHLNTSKAACVRLVEGSGTDADVDYLIGIVNVCFIRAGTLREVNDICLAAGNCLQSRKPEGMADALADLTMVYEEIIRKSTYREMFMAAEQANKLERTK